MPSTIALALWLGLLLALLYFDPAKEGRISYALWLPVIWMFILGSRLPSQWLGGSTGRAAQSLEEGNPLDRMFFIILILASIAILMSRSFRWVAFFRNNLALTALVGFALLSVCWSDYPFVAFKRWFRDLGTYLVILVAITDPSPQEAVRTVLRRFAYLLIPLCILLNKYFPELSKQYDPFSGVATYAGATTSKNMLGVACLVSGLFFFWDTLTRWPSRRKRQTKRIILVNLTFLAMTAWVLQVANSATSKACLALGCFVIAAVNSKTFARHPKFLKAVIPTCFIVYVVLAFGFNLNGEIAGALGRDPTLTDRTKIWGILLGMKTNPLLGTGYESFWLGERLEKFWTYFPGLNEAHNGYLEVYLNLGLIGLFLLVCFLVATYRSICRGLRNASGLASFAFGVWTITLFYNITEAAFKGQLMWFTFLIGVLSIPVFAKRQVPVIPNLSKDHGEAPTIPVAPPLVSLSPWRQ